jgi:hypothetical protein
MIITIVDRSGDPTSFGDLGGWSVGVRISLGGAARIEASAKAGVTA